MAKRKIAEDIEKKREIERKREFMCAHYPLCRGCPLEKVSRNECIGCRTYCSRHPEEAARIVLEWEFEHCPSARPAVE